WQTARERRRARASAPCQPCVPPSIPQASRRSGSATHRCVIDRYDESEPLRVFCEELRANLGRVASTRARHRVRCPSFYQFVAPTARPPTPDRRRQCAGIPSRSRAPCGTPVRISPERDMCEESATWESERQGSRAMRFDPMFIVYVLPLLIIWAFYLRRRRRVEADSVAKHAAAAEAGLLEPASLHPEIDPGLCIGCGACVNACPEGEILGLIDGKASLVEPAECIGHG